MSSATPPFTARVALGDTGAPMERCTNCDAALHGAWCGACGEKQPSHQDWSLAGLFHEVAHTVTNLDGTLGRTLRALVGRPGALTAEYFAGRKQRYMRPFALFVALNLVFFLVQPHTGIFSWRHDSYARRPVRFERMEAARAAAGQSPAVFRARFDATIARHKQSMLLVQIPLFALALALLQLHRRRPLAQHVIFAIHFAGFLLLTLGALTAVVFGVVGIGRVAHAAGATLLTRAIDSVYRLVDREATMSVVLTILLAGWLAAALRRVYAEPTALAVVKGVALVGVLFLTLALFPALLFELTLRSL